jgi:hypothetical protein
MALGLQAEARVGSIGTVHCQNRAHAQNEQMHELDHHLLVFLKKPLSMAHQQPSIYEKEFLTLIMVVEH